MEIFSFFFFLFSFFLSFSFLFFSFFFFWLRKGLVSFASHYQLPINWVSQFIISTHLSLSFSLSLSQLKTNRDTRVHGLLLCILFFLQTSKWFQKYPKYWKDYLPHRWYLYAKGTRKQHCPRSSRQLFSHGRLQFSSWISQFHG